MVVSEGEFWGSQGRVGRIRRGDLQGRHVFVYPDTVEPWWTVVVETSPEASVPDDRYISNTEHFVQFMLEWDVAWLPIGKQELQLESALFGWRPLSNRPSWTHASYEPARFEQDLQ